MQKHTHKHTNTHTHTHTYTHTYTHTHRPRERERKNSWLGVGRIGRRGMKNEDGTGEKRIYVPRVSKGMVREEPGGKEGKREGGKEGRKERRRKLRDSMGWEKSMVGGKWLK